MASDKVNGHPKRHVVVHHFGHEKPAVLDGEMHIVLVVTTALPSVVPNDTIVHGCVTSHRKLVISASWNFHEELDHFPVTAMNFEFRANTTLYTHKSDVRLQANNNALPPRNDGTGRSDRAAAVATNRTDPSILESPRRVILNRKVEKNHLDDAKPA